MDGDDWLRKVWKTELFSKLSGILGVFVEAIYMFPHFKIRVLSTDLFWIPGSLFCHDESNRRALAKVKMHQLIGS